MLMPAHGLIDRQRLTKLSGWRKFALKKSNEASSLSLRTKRRKERVLRPFRSAQNDKATNVSDLAALALLVLSSLCRILTTLSLSARDTTVDVRVLSRPGGAEGSCPRTISPVGGMTQPRGPRPVLVGPSRERISTGEPLPVRTNWVCRRYELSTRDSFLARVSRKATSSAHIATSKDCRRHGPLLPQRRRDMARLDEPLPRAKGRHHREHVFAPSFIPGGSGRLRCVLCRHGSLPV